MRHAILVVLLAAATLAAWPTAAAAQGGIDRFGQVQITSTASNALDIAGGLEAGSGNVQVINASGQVLETAIANGSLLARLADNETITGTWTFPSLTLSNNGPNIGLSSTAATANQRYWGMQALNPGFRMFTANDDLSSQASFWSISRGSGGVTGQGWSIASGSFTWGTPSTTMTLTSTGLSFADNVPILADIGSNGGYMFSGDDNTGIQRDGSTADRMNFMANGSRVMYAGSDGFGNRLNVDVLANFGDQVYFTGITTTASAANAFLDGANNNRIYRSTSTRKAKQDIHPLTLDDARRALLLEPVLYRGLNETDDRPWAGFIAEDVNAVDSTLVTYGADGAPNYVTYDRVPAYLVRLVQDLWRRVGDLEAARAGVPGIPAHQP